MVALQPLLVILLSTIAVRAQELSNLHSQHKHRNAKCPQGLSKREVSIDTYHIERPVLLNSYFEHNTVISINGYKNQITITNAPTSLSTTLTATITSTVTLTVIQTNSQSSNTGTISASQTSPFGGISTNTGIPFFLAIKALAPEKRQAAQRKYISNTGVITTSINNAARFSIIDGRLSSNGGFLTTSTTSSLISFAFGSLDPGSISTTFSLVSETLTWTNQNFPATNAVFCQEMDRLKVSFISPPPVSCVAVNIQSQPVPPKISSSLGLTSTSSLFDLISTTSKTATSTANIATSASAPTEPSFNSTATVSGLGLSGSAAMPLTSGPASGTSLTSSGFSSSSFDLSSSSSAPASSTTAESSTAQFISGINPRLLQNGQPCTANAACESTYCNLVGSGTNEAGTCGQAFPGQPCTRDSGCAFSLCQYGNPPTPAQLTCGFPSPSGFSCTANSGCLSNFCDFTTDPAAPVCANVPASSSCYLDSDCTSGFCDTSFGSIYARCKPKASYGGFCSKDSGCQGSYCITQIGSCRLPVDTGTCYDDRGCKSGFCDRLTHYPGTCAAPKVNGQPCDENIGCVSGSCDSSSTSPGICADPKSNGLACSQVENCISGSCDSSTGSQICVSTKVNGEQCTDDPSCLSQFCDFSNSNPGVCAARKANALFCQSYRTCISLSCEYIPTFGNSVCRAKIDIGGSCKEHFNCVSGVCKPGISTSTCVLGGQNLNDKCNSSLGCSIGLECLDIGYGGVCKKSDGGMCDPQTQDTACASGFCSATTSQCVAKSGLGDDCTKQSGCSSELYCNINLVGPMQCKAKMQSGMSCIEGYSCGTGSCTGAVGSQTCT